MIVTAEEARRTLDRALRLVRADGALATLTGREAGHLRFARSEATTAGEISGAGLTVNVSIGRRIGAASTNQIDPVSVEAAVRAAESIARLAPEDPEFVPHPGPQTYARVDAWSPVTAQASPERRAQVAAAFIEEARASRLVAAGFCGTVSAFRAVASSAGLFAYHRQTGASISGTVRTPEGTSSGWAAAVATDLGRLDAAEAGRAAARKAVAGVRPREVPPGRYTVILEPAAVAGLVAFMFSQMDARRAAEGRSAMSRRGGETALGERIAAQGITLRSDPASASSPSQPFDEEGFPIGPVAWIEGGVLRALPTTRSWAERAGIPHLPRPAALLVNGGTSSTETMIQETPRGLLVTRFWYVRLVDPRTLLLTGLTRDGLFLIEGGRITAPVRNLRFNESPLKVLALADRLGPAVPVRTGEDQIVEAPPLRSHEFEFTSASGAI